MTESDLQIVNFSAAELIGANLTQANLTSANFTGANLIRANLCQANLCQANLRDANLNSTNLTKANLNQANLYQAELRDANLQKADLEKTNFSQADLTEANLSQANLQSANLSQANLSEADLLEANLSEANLVGADLSRADLSRANLFKGDLSDAILVETQALLANFKQCILTGACLEKLKINQKTCFEDITCNQIYLKYSQQQSYQKQEPQNLTTQEFTEIINSLIGSVDLFFDHNIDWFVFLLPLQKIEVQYNIKKIYIREIEYIQKNSLRINVVIAANFDNTNFIKYFWHKYALIMSAKGNLIKKQRLNRKILTKTYKIETKYQGDSLKIDRISS